MQYASRVDVDFDVVAVAFAVAVSDATSSTSRTHMRQIFGRFVLLWRRRSSCRGQLINMHLVSSAERERERQWQRESERQRVRQIERVRKTGNFRLLQLQKFTGNLRIRDARISRWSPLWGTLRCRWRYWQCWRSCHTSKCRVLARRLINMYESP